MMKFLKKLKVLFFFTGLVAPVMGFAEYYAGLSGSWVWQPDHEFSQRSGFSSPIIVRNDYEFKYKDGAGINAALGYEIDECFRAELEGLYRKNKMRYIRETQVTQIQEQIVNEPTSGNFSITALMANVYYDYSPWDAFTLYVGGGIGVALTRFYNPSVDVVAGGLSVKIFDSAHNDVHFAWQGLAGVEIPLTGCLSFVTGYRLLGLPKIKNPQVVGLKTKQISLSHSLDIGLRYYF